MQNGNLYKDASPPVDGERFETLLSHKGMVIERIVSSSKIKSHEYVQEQDEWIVLLKGNAVLEISGERRQLAAGDYVFLPSKVAHTVISASDGALWLAIHLHAGAVSA